MFVYVEVYVLHGLLATACRGAWSEKVREPIRAAPSICIASLGTCHAWANDSCITPTALAFYTFCIHLLTVAPALVPVLPMPAWSGSLKHMAMRRWRQEAVGRMGRRMVLWHQLHRASGAVEMSRLKPQLYVPFKPAALPLASIASLKETGKPGS